jgi:hypothetical protein
MPATWYRTCGIEHIVPSIILDEIWRIEMSGIIRTGRTSLQGWWLHLPGDRIGTGCMTDGDFIPITSPRLTTFRDLTFDIEKLPAITPANQTMVIDIPSGDIQHVPEPLEVPIVDCKTGDLGS